MTLDKTLTNTVKINRFATIMNELDIKYNGRYSYDKFIYSGMKVKGVITCHTHGDFEQNLSVHLQGQGCPKCGIELTAEKNSKSFDEFVKESAKIHKNFYTYEEDSYSNTNKKVTITCPTHGVFQQRAIDHMKGRGCNKCARLVANSNITHTKNEFVQAANKKHKGKYDYSNTVYVSNKDKITITCPYHGDFIQTPSDHIQGNGCQLCGNKRSRAKYIKEPTILYYLYLPKFNLYKIGVTLVSVGVKKRYAPEAIEYIILKEVYFLSGEFAYKKEQELLNKYAQYKYSGPKVFKRGGTSECFIKDVLNNESIT